MGATFARQLVDGGREVLMVDAGSQLSRLPGEHLKNSYVCQQDLNSFTGLISSQLHDLSVPTNIPSVWTLDPAAFQVTRSESNKEGYEINWLQFLAKLG